MTEFCTTVPTAASPDVATRQLQDYMTIVEAAKLLRRKTWPIYEAIHSGDLHACQPGNEGAWLIRPADLLSWVERSADAPKRPLSASPAGGTLRERIARAQAGRL